MSQNIIEFNFDTDIEATLVQIKELLLVKGKEYRRNNDVYHNFNVGAKISGQIPEKVLQGFLLKHLVSYRSLALLSAGLMKTKFNN